MTTRDQDNQQITATYAAPSESNTDVSHEYDYMKEFVTGGPTPTPEEQEAARETARRIFFCGIALYLVTCLIAIGFGFVFE